jgi:hypothetical protein
MALRQEWVYVKGKQVVVNHFTGVSKDTVPQADLCLQWVLQADQVQELQAGLLRKYHSGGQSTCMPSAWSKFAMVHLQVGPYFGLE